MSNDEATYSARGDHTAFEYNFGNHARVSDLEKNGLIICE